MGLSLPPNFIDLIDEETTRCFRTTVFNKDNKERGTGKLLLLVTS
jgi:hypothetical protein